MLPVTRTFPNALDTAVLRPTPYHASLLSKLSPSPLQNPLHSLKRPVTMADVAARLGVSKMTVSRALQRTASSPRAGAEALRQNILQACDEMGYVMDHTARTFSSQRSGFVAALIPTLNNSNFSETEHGLAQAVEAGGLQLLLGRTDYLVETEERLVRTMLMRRPEGVVLTGDNHSAATRGLLQAAGIPVVETWDLPKVPIGHTVGFSNADATAALVHYLHAKGYRRIAFMGGTSERDPRGVDRRQGYSRAMQALGLGAGCVVSAGEPPVSMEQGRAGMQQLMQQWPEADAAVCVSDHCAFGALMECHRQGWAVPGRIGIAGFGDFEVGKSCFPRITTVAMDCVDIGVQAGELLLQAIAAARRGQAFAAQTVLVPFRIEARESA